MLHSSALTVLAPSVCHLGSIRVYKSLLFCIYLLEPPLSNYWVEKWFSAVFSSSFPFSLLLTVVLSYRPLSCHRLIFMFAILKLKGNGTERKGRQFAKIFLEITKKLEEFEDGDTFRLTGCSVWVFPLVIVKRKDRLKREHIFDVRLWAPLLS